MRLAKCCRAMEARLRSGDLVAEPSTDAATGIETLSISIHGEPTIVDDGDGHTSDITESIEIQYCPFCGVPIVDAPIQSG